MTLDRKRLMLLAAAGSFAMILGAWFFEYVIGLAPCQMCYWQRWPHWAAAGLGLVALALPTRAIAALGALAALTTGGLGVYHVGVEQKWWPGPASCTGLGDSLSGLSGADLLSTDAVPTLVLCDEISWQFLWISMPGWNAIISFAFAAIWIAAATRPNRA